MDKKNVFLGTLFVIAAAICFYISARYTPVRPNPAAIQEAASPAPSAAAPGQMPVENQPPEFASANADSAGAAIAHLQNSYIEAYFTDFGGALRTVALEKYPAAENSPQPFVLNDLHKDPMAAFVELPGLDRGTRYQQVPSGNDREVIYRTIWNNQIEVTRRYTISPDVSANSDPYLIHCETTFRNLTNQVVTLPVLQFALGTAAPLSTDERGLQLTTIASRNGSQTYIPRSSLQESRGWFGLIGGHGPVPDIQTEGPLQWAAVANQFFLSLYTPEAPDAATGMVTRRVKVLLKKSDSDAGAYGVTADAVFSLPPIAPHGTATLAGSLYTGPKEYHRLANIDVFKRDQDRIMHWGWFRFFSALLLTLMTWMHHLVPNWGIAIILTTLLLKIVFLPFTLAASRSAKRMQKIQPELQAIKEKYKDNAQKQQMATMELFKQHRVNPVGGCLPMLITLPFFWGFFRMLYTAAELRFAPFLWAHDLSAPDTVATVFGIPINVMPLILGATMLLQMKFTPQPTVDNSQAKMMKLMPLLFMFICYFYSCALSLYSTVNALFSIVQQMVINRTKDDDPQPALAAAGRGGKSLKNVTPRRR